MLDALPFLGSGRAIGPNTPKSTCDVYSTLKVYLPLPLLAV